MPRYIVTLTNDEIQELKTGVYVFKITLLKQKYR